MSLGYPVGFRILIPEPVEVKMISATIAVRDAIEPIERYRGLFTYCLETDTFYYLRSGITNQDWEPVNKPNSVSVLDQFNEGKQTIVSGYALKEYLNSKYYTKDQVDELLKEAELPSHIASISKEDVQKLKTIEGDISKRIEFPIAQIVWTIDHPSGKSVQTFLTDGTRIYGREKSVSLTRTLVSWSKYTTGFAKIN